MKKEKKQLRELSEEDLKKVTGGGYIQLIDFNTLLDDTDSSTPPSLPTVPPVDGTCPEGYMLVTTGESSLCCPA